MDLEGAPPATKRQRQLTEMPPEDLLQRAKDIALNALQMSAKSRGQLEEKLASKDIPADVAAEALDRLTEVGLIDDAAFAGSWAGSRQRGMGLSGSAIQRELRQKGVSEEFVAAAMEQITPETEHDRAVEMVRRRAPGTRNLDRNARVRRLVGMLARKGYGGGVAFAVVKQVLAEEQPDDVDDGYLDSGQD